MVSARAVRLMPEYTGFARKTLMLGDGERPAPIAPAPFVELGVASPFSFLRGASDSIELVLAAHAMGMDSIGIADRDTLAGVVRMHSAAKGAGLRPLVGCRLMLPLPPEREGAGGRACAAVDRPSPSALCASSPPAGGRGECSLLAYPLDREGYGRLSRLLSLGKMRSAKGDCDLTLDEIAAHAEGIAFIAMPGGDLEAFAAGHGGKVERRPPALERRRGGEIGDDRAGIKRARTGRDVAVETSGRRQDQVRHLAFPGIFRPIERTRPDFDPHHPAGRDPAQQGRQALGLAARPGAVEHHIARSAGEAANIAVTLIEVKAWGALDDVEGAARCETCEKAAIVDACPAGRGLRYRRAVLLRRRRRCRRHCRKTHRPMECCPNVHLCPRRFNAALRAGTRASKRASTVRRTDRRGSVKGCLAERVGFEPTVRLPARRFSRPLP